MNRTCLIAPVFILLATSVAFAQNPPPQVINPVPDTVLTVGQNDAFVVDLSTVFADPGDSLTFAARSLAEGVATVSLPDSVLTVSLTSNPASAEAEIVTSATDTAGSAATDTFVVFVNFPPTVANPIPEQFLTVVNPVFMTELGEVFTDTDVDTLMFAARSFNPNVAAAGVESGSMLVVQLAAMSQVGDTTTVFVTANDGRGGTANTTFVVTVENSRPQIQTAIQDTALTVGQNVVFRRNLAEVFSDPDEPSGDVLTFTASTDTTKIRAEIASDGTTLEVTFADPVPDQRTTVPVTYGAEDSHGAVKDSTFDVIINFPPMVSGVLPNPHLTRGDTVLVVDLDGIFTDPDGDTQTYQPVSGNDTLDVEMTDRSLLQVFFDRLIIVDPSRGMQADSVVVTVTAQDPFGGRKDTSFVVLVNDPPYIVTPIDPATLTVSDTVFTVDLDAVFADPDPGDRQLFYRTATENDTVQADTVSRRFLNVAFDSTISIVPAKGIAADSAGVTVAATDLRGGKKLLRFSVAINDPPVVSSPVSDFFLTVGGVDSLLALNSIFFDPDPTDRARLKFIAVSSDSGIAVADTSLDSLHVALGDSVPAQRDTAAIKVTAIDGRGGDASDAFQVIVNHPPEIRQPNPVREDTLTVGGGVAFTLPLDSLFVDPDGDPLRFPDLFWSTDTTADDSGKIRVEIDDPQQLLTVQFDTTAIVDSVGVIDSTLAIKVTADDTFGGRQDTTFALSINDPPFVTENTFDDLRIKIGTKPNIRIIIKINEEPRKFKDPDNDRLEFSATSSDTNVATVEVKAGSDTLRIIPSPDTTDSPATVTTTSIIVNAMDNKGGADSTAFKLEVTRNLDASIELDARTDSLVAGSLLAPEGSTLTITADIVDEEELNGRPLLFYRRGGDLSFVRKEMFNQGGITYAATMEDTATSRGAEFYIEVEDRELFKTRRPAKGVHYIRVRVPRGVRKKAPQPEKTYRLISVPLNLDDKSPQDLLVNQMRLPRTSSGTPDKTQWRFFQPALFDTEQPVEFDALPGNFEMARGKAFWLIVNVKGAEVNVRTGAGTSDSTNVLFPIPLQNGWNYIGNPFNFPATALRTTAKDTSVVFYTFDEKWSDPLDNPDEVLLQPFEGYAVRAFAEDILFINPDRSGNQVSLSKPAANQEEEAWRIRIRAQSRDAIDDNNLAGVSGKSVNQWDRRDLPEPPVIGDYISLYFPHPEWQRPVRKFTTDFRSLSGEGYLWEFDIKTNMRDEVSLTFGGLRSVPQTYEVWLLDKAADIALNLRQTNHYAIAGEGPQRPKRLKLLIGTADFLQGKVRVADQIPATYELSQNFPNPFNPTTTIRYGLPQAGRVSLKIYNLLGKVVTTLIDDETREAGFHVAVWNGRDFRDKPVASGLYVYRLRSQSFSQVRKMVVVH